MSKFPPPLPLPARTISPSRPNGSFFHQAAKASWVVPIIAAVLGFAGNSARNPNAAPGADNGGQLVIGAVNAFLIIVGLILGIVALFGIKRHGTHGILSPAIVGIVLNGLLVLAMASLFFTLWKGSTQALANANRAAPVLTQAQYQDEALAQYPGWVGADRYNGAMIVLVEIASQSQMGTEMAAGYATRCKTMLLTVDNSQGSAPLAVDTTTIHLIGTGGRRFEGLSMEQSIMNRRAKGSPWAFEPIPTIIPAHNRQLQTLPVYVPLNVDLNAIDKVEIKVDEATFIVKGSVLSVEQKAERMRRAQSTSTPDPQ